MPRRFPFTFVAITLLAVPAHAQTLADARTCERAIMGSATDRVAMQRMAAGSTSTRHFAAGCLSVTTAQWDSAARQFDAATSANPRSSAAFLWVGNITAHRARLGDTQTKLRLAPAIRDAYQKAITLDGANIDAREGLMQYLLATPAPLGGDKVKAAEQATAIGKVDPYRGLGAALAVASANGDKATVERLLLGATTTYPDSVIGWANLSAMQADAGRHADAFATITRWQARRTNAMFALFSIGRTAAVSGQQLQRGEQALQQYLRGRRGPNDPPLANANYRLGQVYEKQGRKAEARTAYQTALRSNPSMRDASVALERVK
ncbi:MAG: tetratricopeptide repeat protein [Gemmatimonadota bacterium]